MKKRLLSAALALAMVLTLLPFSAMPVSAASTATLGTDQSGKCSVTWRKADFVVGKDADGNDVKTPSDGYYYWDGASRTLYSTTSGVLNGTNATSGTWYDSPVTANGILSSFTLIGNITVSGAHSASSINVNLNNKSLDLQSYTDAATTKLSGLTVTNTPVTGTADKTQAVTLPSGWSSLSDRSITLNVTNATVTATSSITITGAVGNNYGFSATLTNAVLTGPVYVNGVPNNSSSLRLDMRGDSSANSGICATYATLDLDMKAGDSVGGVTCKGKKATIDANGYPKRATIGSIDLGGTDVSGASENKSGGTINLVSAADVTGAINTFGQTTINVKDTSTVGGNISFLSGKATDGVNGAAPNWTGTNINVTGYQARVGGIIQAADDSLKATVKVDDTAACGAIALNEYGGTITVSHATTGNIGMGLGTLIVDNGATVNGSISVGTKGAANATISGANTTVSGVVNPNNKGTTLVINDGKFTSTEIIAVGNPSTNVPKIRFELEKGTTTVKGGTFGGSLQGSPVLSGIAYEFKNLNDKLYTYVRTAPVNDVFKTLVDMTQAAGGVNKTQIIDSDYDYDVASTQGGAYVLFKVDHNTTGGVNNTPVSVLQILGTKDSVIDLPDQVGGRKVSYWYKGEERHQTNYIITAEDVTAQNPGGGATGTPVTLFADSTAAGSTDITAVALDTAKDVNGLYKGLTISLDASGKVIKLSGLVDLAGKNSASIPLKLVNSRGDDTKLKVNALVSLSSNGQKRVYFTDPSTGLTISGDNSILTVANSTQQFTLDGSGLVVRDINLPISVAGSNNGTTNGIAPGKPVAKVNGGIAGTAGRESYKNALEANSQFATSGDNQLKNSIAVQQSLNNVLKSVTKSQVDNWLATARRTIATELKDTNSAKYAETYAAWDTIEVEPYLDIVVNNWTNKTGNASSASLDVNLTLKYRVVAVHRNSAAWPTGMTQEQQEKFKRVEVTTGNLTLTGDYGDIQLTLALPDEFVPTTGTTLYAHHGNYAYGTTVTGSNRTRTVTFTTSHGFSPFTINEKTPVAQSSKIIRNGVAEGKDYGANDISFPYLYDNLDTAVAEVADKGAIKLFPGFKTGTTDVPVSGKARIFRVITEANSQTKLNFTGSNTKFTGDEANGNMTYTVTLSSDTAVAPTQKPIPVSAVAVTGGSASLSASRADEGDTITVTLLPVAGYAAAGVAVRTDTGASVVVNGSGTRYTFVVPKGINVKSITVTPSFTKVNSNATVTVSNPAVGGTAATTAGNNQVAPGTPVTVTVSPTSGYRTMGIYVTNATASRTGANTFSFTVPANTTNVVVTPRFDRTNGTLFEDVWSYDYFSSAVAWAVGRGITNGDGSVYRFGTGKSCTREDMVTFLWRNAGSPVVSGVTNPFWDVQVGSYYYNAVMWAIKNGITKGVSSNQFGVGRPVTRGEAVTFLYRAAGEPAASTNSGFYDVPSSQYYAKAVTWAVGKGITNGDGSTVRFNPNGSCLREQIVTFMYRNATGTRA